MAGLLNNNMERMSNLSLKSSLGQKHAPLIAQKHSKSQLPDEIWEQILHHLEMTDIKSLRLASKIWIDVGALFLFRPFIFRPDRNKYDVFNKKLAHTPIAKAISNIRFELGTQQIDFAAHNIGYAYYHALKTLRDDPRPESVKKAQYELLEEDKIAAMTEYAEWNERWHEMDQTYQSRSGLEEIFSKTEALTRIDISYKSCPFKSELAMDAWMQRTDNYNFRKTNQEFVAILRTLTKAPNKLQHLSHDQLPVSFFMAAVNDIVAVAAPLHQLRTLPLTLDATASPHNTVWRMLGSFLKTLPELKDLRLDFASLPTRFDNEGTWKSSWYLAEEWYAPLSKILGKFTWKNLEAVWLGGLVLCEKGLTQFFSRHAKTLKSIKLSNIGLIHGSFQRVFSYLARLPLREFRIWGYFKALHFANEIWRFCRCYGPCDDNWSKVFTQYVKKRDSEDMLSWRRSGRGRLSNPEVRAMIENFVLQTPNSLGEIWAWPLMYLDSLDRYYLNEHSEDGDGCTYPEENMDALWEDGLTRSLKDCRDAWVETIYGVGEPPIIGFYDKAGFDEFGFDCDGYAKGERPPVSDQPGTEEIRTDKFPVTRAQCYRIIHQGIRCRIPRYSELDPTAENRVLRPEHTRRKNCHVMKEVDWRD
ncbi:uncharacterized protein LY89DRAFT_790192 [Mollisia scopiformis]|uniref:F-box domain-containing protein n=1 Tax=Mollisia scopiformis TaxID=149040 RepID=A0A132B557_MOLSC|nr:uncharacterized protein LY89DRAFT_790192 [Mollisia scopiformis]KUJ06807.1 hypothetical protein LY89DRAFT_790192 [Mollisia scopiformis]